MDIRYPFFLFIYFLLFINSYSQVYVSGGYYVKHFTDEAGLPQNSVIAMYQAPDGLVWLVTYDDVLAFDGLKFRGVRSNFPGWRIGVHYFLSLPNANKALLSNLKKNYFLIGKEQEVFFKAKELHNYIRYTVDELSTLYNSNVVFKIPYQNQTLFEAASNEVYVVPTTAKGLYLLAEDSVSFYNDKQIKWGKKINGKYNYFFMQERLYVWNHLDDVIISYTPDGEMDRVPFKNLKDIFFNRATKDVFFIDKDDALYLYHGIGKEPEYLMKLDESFRLCSALRRDAQTILLGSNTKGFLVCKKKQFRTQASDCAPLGVFYAIAPFSDSSVLTTTGYIVNSSGKTTPFKKDGKDIDFNERYIGVKGREEYIFSPVNEGGSLIGYKKNGKKLEQYGSKSDDYINTISEKDGDILWYSSYGNEVFSLRGNERKKVFQTRSGVNSIRVLNEQYLLLGCDSGLCVYDKTRKKLIENNSTRDLLVTNIYKSPSNNVYVLTRNNGFFILRENGEVRKLPPDKVGWLRSANCILVDKLGMAWITANRGLFCIPENELLREEYAEGYAPYFYFGKDNGFNTNEFNGGCSPCGVYLPNGEMVFPSMDGLVWFNPELVHFDFPQYPPLLDKVLADGNEMDIGGDTVFIGKDFRRLEFYYDIPFLGNRKNNLHVEYNYQPEGEWIPLEEGSPILLSSIGPRFTKLSVRVRTGFGENDYMYSTLVLHRKPKLMETWFGWFMLALGVGILTFTIIRLNSLRLIRKNKALEVAIQNAQKTILQNMEEISATNKMLIAKNRFFSWLVSSIVHDIKGPLHFVAEVGDMYGKSDKPDDHELRFLRAVLLTSKRIYAYSNRLIQALMVQQEDFLKPENVNIGQIINEKVEQFYLSLNEKKITVEVDVNTHYLNINPLAFEIILHNLLDNSIKNQEGGKLYIRFRREDGGYVLEVEDNGEGMPEDMLLMFNKVSDDINYAGSSGLGIWLIFSMVKFTSGQINYTNKEKGLLARVKWNSTSTA